MSATNIIMKVHDFDESSKSLVVSFTSDTSPISVDDAPRLAFQPTIFDDSDPEMIIKRLAQAGVSVAAEQDKKAALSQDIETLNIYKDKIGQTYTFNIVELHDELFGSTEQNVTTENVTTENVTTENVTSENVQNGSI